MSAPRGSGAMFGYGAGASNKQDLALVEDTMTEVRRNWGLMLQEDFNPITIALDMIQTGSGGSGLGHDHEQFMKLHERLDESMGVIVEKYYTRFNNAVSIFGGIVDNMNVSQVRKDLVEFRDHVQYKRTELPEIWSTVQEYKKTIAATSKLDHISRLRQDSQELLRRRFFIPAARTLMDAMYDARYLRSAVGSDSSLYPALIELSKALDVERDSMFDSILDEIQRVMYFTEKRHGHQLFARLLELVPEASALNVGDLRRLDDALIDPALSLLDADLILAPKEFEFEPDTNAIAYLRSLVRAAATMELLPHMLQLVAQKIVAQLRQLTAQAMQRASKEFRLGLRSAISNQKQAGGSLQKNDDNRGGTQQTDLSTSAAKNRSVKSSTQQQQVITADPFAGARGLEFRLFLPVLHRSCEFYFGHLLTVAASLRVIGDAVSEIINAQTPAKDQSKPETDSNFDPPSSSTRPSSSTANSKGSKHAKLHADIPSFYRNCLNAMHAEVRSFLTCLLHGPTDLASQTSESGEYVAILDALRRGVGPHGNHHSSKSSSKASSPIVDNRSGVVQYNAGNQSTRSLMPSLSKAKQQQLLPGSILYRFNFTMQDEDIPKVLLHTTAVQSRAEEAAARKLAALLVVDPFSPNQINTQLQPPIPPTVHFLPTIYEPFIVFIDHLDMVLNMPETITDGKQTTDGNGSSVEVIDVHFMEQVLLDEFLPAVEADVLQDLSRAFNAPESLLWQSLLPVDQTKAVGRGSDCMVNCVSRFISLALHVLSLIHRLKHGRSALETLLMRLMDQFLAKSLEKFKMLVKTDRTAQESKSYRAISSVFARDTALSALYEEFLHSNGDQEGQQQQLSGEADALLAEKEGVLLELLKRDRSLHLHEVIFDYRRIRSLLLLQRSLDLVPRVLQDQIGVYLKGNIPRLSHDGSHLVSTFFDGRSKRTTALSAELEIDFANFTSFVRKQCITCLNTLRIEVRSHCFYYMDLAYREGSYSMEEESNEPDPYISTLASDVIRFESVAAEWLPYHEYHCVFDALGSALCAMLIGNFRYIRSLNALGCRKLLMNVATLEQLLALVSTRAVRIQSTDQESLILHQSPLDAAREYYRLVAAGTDRLIELIPSCSHRFTMKQYQAIFDVYYSQSGTISEELRSTHQNQMVRLQYLIEGSTKDSESESTNSLPVPIADSQENVANTADASASIKTSTSSNKNQ